MAGDEREQRVVLALSDVFAGLVLRAALANMIVPALTSCRRNAYASL